MDESADSLAIRVEDISNRAFAFVPLPWRVIFLIGATILCWASNLQFLHFMGIDTAFVLDMHSQTDMAYQQPLTPTLPHLSLSSFQPSAHLYPAVYKQFGVYGVWSFGCWMLFRALCGGDTKMMDHYKIIPELCAIGILAALVCPFNVFRKRERDLFLQALFRCLFSQIKQPIYFADVVLADIFTSLAKVMGDVWISICMLAPGGSLHRLPIFDGWSQWIVPCTMCLPYLARLRQCIIEYLTSHQHSNRRALFNAIKYATAFPVIFLSAAQRLVDVELDVGEAHIVETPGHGGSVLFKLWVLAVVINSGYSFWWDVTNDWGLSLLEFRSDEPRLMLPPRRLLLPQLHKPHPSFLDSHRDGGEEQPSSRDAAHSRYPRGLRSVMLFNDPIVYYIAIGLNLILRLTWSLKLSSHLYTVAELEGGVFLMEALEVIRRWVWVFFRVEWEAIKKGGNTVAGKRNDLQEEMELETAQRSVGLELS